MPVETPEQLAGWDAVQEALGEIRTCHGDFDSFFGEVFDQLDGLASELTHRGKQWLAERQQTQGELAQRAEEIERQQAMLAQRQRELETALGDGSAVPIAAPDPAMGQLLDDARRQREQMQGVQDAVQAQVARLAEVAAELVESRTRLGEPPENGSADADSMRRWLDEMQVQQQQLLAAQQAAQGQAEQLAGAAGELASAREAWTVAQQQLQEHREQLDDIHAAFSSSQINSGGDDDQLKQQVDELRQQHVELQQQHGQLEQERTLLESELETVRNRAAEMTESLADQKRSLALQQTQWADELKHMRRLMEGMSRRLAEPPPPQPDRPAEPQLAAVAVGSPAEASSGDDPVLDSVMAQFQMLQQDLARRRTQQP